MNGLLKCTIVSVVVLLIFVVFFFLFLSYIHLNLHTIQFCFIFILDFHFISIHRNVGQIVLLLLLFCCYLCVYYFVISCCVSFISFNDISTLYSFEWRAKWTFTAHSLFIFNNISKIERTAYSKPNCCCIIFFCYCCRLSIVISHYSACISLKKQMSKCRRVQWIFMIG